MNTRIWLIWMCLAILVTGWSSCSSYQVIPLKNANPELLKDHALVYSLPRTVFRVEVLAEKTSWKAGPLAPWAAKYLGIRDVPLKDSVAWTIRSAALIVSNEPDSGQLYLVSTKGDSPAALLSLLESGIIQGVNLPENQPGPAHHALRRSVLRESATQPLFRVPLGQDKEKVDTTFKTIRADTNLMRIPVLKKQVVQKSQEDQAADVARQIQELREEKISILLGENNRFPDGKALEVIVSELSRLEEEYLSLFTGYRTIESGKFEMEAIPGEGKAHEQIPLFGFSSGKGLGFTDELIKALRPVFYLDIQSAETCHPIGSYLAASDTLIHTKAGFYVRIPETATVRLTNSFETLFSVRVPIAQYGKTWILPRRVLKDKHSTLRISGTTGSLIELR